MQESNQADIEFHIPVEDVAKLVCDDSLEFIA